MSRERDFEIMMARKRGIRRGVRVGISDGRIGKIIGSQDYWFQGARGWIIKLDDGEEYMDTASNLNVVTIEWINKKLRDTQYEMANKIFDALDKYKNGIPVKESLDDIKWLETKFEILQLNEKSLTAELEKLVKKG